MKHVLLAISGPSGVGKGTIVKKILSRRKDVMLSVSCTTRLPREGETHGKEYFFISREEFFKHIDEGDFLEYDEHFGNYYGTLMSLVKEALKEQSVILEIDVVGALNAKKYFPECVLIMVVPPSIEELQKRLRGRNSETEEEIQKRLDRLTYEISQQKYYDYVVVNGELEAAAKEIENIIDENKKILNKECETL